LFFALSATAADSGNLRVGAAKVDITPKTGAGLKNVWGKEFQGIHDHIFVRAIVLDNGLTGAALISIDTSSRRTLWLCGGGSRRKPEYLPNMS